MSTPWKHQREIVAPLKAGNYLLAWEPGVGKTRPLLEAGADDRQLYLCPAAVRYQVAAEAERYGLREAHDIQVIGKGTDKVRADAGLVVCSYDLACNPKVWAQLYKAKWGSLVLDEGHLLKTPDARRTKAVYGARPDSKGALFLRAERTWVATGTPILNDPSELWTHVSRLFPEARGELRTKADFLQRFCHYTETPWGPKIHGGKNLDELKRRLGPYLSRLRKEQVLDLPPLLIDELVIEPVEIDESTVPEEALTELRRLLAEFPQDFMLEHLALPLSSLRRQIGLAKATHVAGLVASEMWHGTEKVLMFYQHTDVGHRIMHEMRHYGPVLYSGTMSATAKKKAVETFCDDPKARVFVGQIQAAGTGLNLQVADRVVLVEPAWTPALNEQAICRAFRGGQTKPVRASFCVLKDSVDEVVSRALVRKTKTIRKLMDDETC